MCLNYLDTQSAPLTNLQITIAAALVAKMAGQPADEDKRSLRLAQITQYVEQLYTDRFEEWISADASRLDDVARHAMAVTGYKTAHLPVTTTFLEAWTEFQHAASGDERQSLISRWKRRKFPSSSSRRKPSALSAIRPSRSSGPRITRRTTCSSK